MKKLFLFCLLFLSVSLFFTNCELDDTVNTNEQTSDDLELEQPTIKTVSYDNVGAKFSHLKTKYQLDTYMQLQDVTSELRTTQDTLGITIYTDVIKEITLGDYTSYTMRIAIKDSESTAFYNITLEDKGGEEGFFVTKYTPTDNWLADTKQPYEGGIETMRGESFSPDEGGGISISLSDFTHEGEEEIEGTGTGENFNNNTSYGPQNGSPYYPYDCFGEVVMSIESVPYQCTCEDHWPWQSCECTLYGGEGPGYVDIPWYYCIPFEDDNWEDPTDPSDTNDTGTLTGGGGSNNGIGGAGDGETESITTVVGPDDGAPCDPVFEEDLNNDCYVSDYERCVYEYGSADLCDCIADGGEMSNCIENCMVSNDVYNSYYSANSPCNVDLSDVRDSCDNINTENVEENKKFMCIYKKLTQSPNFISLFIGTFGESENLNVNFKISNTISGNGLTVTNQLLRDPTTNEVTSADIDILISKNYITSASSIAVAKTILHEFIHAFLIVKQYGCDQGAPLFYWNNVELSEQLNEYFLNCAPQQGQHEFMFNAMIPTMSQILADVKDDLVPESHQQIAESYMFINEETPTIDVNGDYVEDVPWDWNEFYKYLSVHGLDNSSAFHFAYGDIDNPIQPYFKNYSSYANIGVNSFSDDCID